MVSSRVFSCPRNTAFATLGIEFHPTSLDPETAEITKRKGQCKVDLKEPGRSDHESRRVAGKILGRGIWTSECDGGETRGSRLIAQHGVNDALALSHSL